MRELKRGHRLCDVCGPRQYTIKRPRSDEWAEGEPNFTGIYDHHGNEIYRTPEPRRIGYRVGKRPF